MIRTPKLSRSTLLVSFPLLWLGVAPQTAGANGVKDVCEGKERQVTITGKAQSFDIGLLRNGDVRVHLPSGIKAISVSREGPLIYRRPQGSNDEKTIYLRFKDDATVGDVASARLESASGFEVRLDVEQVDKRVEATAELTVMHITEVERERARIDGLVEEQVRDHEREDALRRLERVQGWPIEDPSHKQDGPISVKVLYAEWENDLMYVYFTARSHVSQPRKLGAVAALDEHGEPIGGTRVYFKSDTRERESDEITSEAPGVKLVDVLLKGESSEKGLIIIPAASDRDRDVFGLRLYGTEQAALTESILKAWRLTPVTEEQWAREQRAKQTTVSVRMLGGGFWTSPGDDLNGLDGTTIAGVGVRYQHGYANTLALEVDGVIARTGGAQFEDMQWGNEQGVVTRRATLGRLGASGAVRLGHDYVATIRIGLGIQVASYVSTFSFDGMLMDGPGDGVEIDGVWSVGGSFDTRVGEYWSLGAAATFASTFYRGPRSLEAGLHLGYGWN